MKTLNPWLKCAGKLALVLVIYVGLQVGCGSDEAEEVVEETESCDELLSGNVETGEVLRDNHDIHSMDYQFVETGQFLFSPRNEENERVGELELNVSNVGEASKSSNVQMRYEPEWGEPVEFSHRMTAFFAHTQLYQAQANPLIAQEVDLKFGGEVWGARFLGELKHGDFAQASEDNPMIEGQSVMLFYRRDDGSEEILELDDDIEIDELETLVEEWAQGTVVEEMLDAPEVAEALNVATEMNVYEEFRKVATECRRLNRAGGDVGSRSDALEGGVCGAAYESAAWVNLVGKFTVTGIGAIVLLSNPAGWLGFVTLAAGVLGGLLPPGWSTAVGFILVLVLVAKVGLAVGLIVGAAWFAREISQWVLDDADRVCGNPLLISGDGTAFPFQATGEYIWMRAGPDDAMDIQVRSEPNAASTCEAGAHLTAAAMQVGDHRVAFYPDRDAPLWVDGAPAEDFEYFHSLGADGQISAAPRGGQSQYLVEWASGAKLTVDVIGERLDLDLELPAELQTSRQGLLGDSQGELRARGGQVLSEPVVWQKLHRDFAQSWQVTDEESLFDYLPGESADSFETSFPSSPRSLDDLSDEQREFGRHNCVDRGGVTDPILLRHCILDVGCTGDPGYMLSYTDVGPPRRQLEIVDESGADIVGLYDDAGVGGVSLPGGGHAPMDSVQQASSCPSDIEESAESVGGSQIRTVDGRVYEFQAAGEFVLVESRGMDGLAAHVRQEPGGSQPCPDARRNTALAVRLGNHRLSFDVDREDHLWIDGEPTQMNAGFHTFGDGYSVVRTELNKYFIEWPDRTWLHVELRASHMDIKFNAHYTRLGQLQGLFGQFNGYPDNDIALRSGEEVSPVNSQSVHGEYAESWRISQSESLFDYADGQSTDDYIDRDVPSSMMSVDDVPEPERDDAQQSCEDVGVEDEQIMGACIIDVYCTGDPSAAEPHGSRSPPNSDGDDDDDDDDDDDEEDWVNDVPGSGDLCCHIDCPDGPDPDCGFVCGTGEFEEAHEWCDGDCPITDGECPDEDPDDTCTWGAVETYFDDPERSAYACASRCVQREQWQCIDDNDCCPSGGQCTSITDNDCDIVPHVGSGCTEDEHCATVGEDAPDSSSTYCIDEESSLMFGGFCTVTCQEDSHCPDGTHCAEDALFRGNVGQMQSWDSHVCVPSCDSDDDCEREGYGCYDANGDGRDECWHMGIDDEDFGDTCELSRDCGEIGYGAVCLLDGSYLIDEEPENIFFCSQRCDIGDVECPDGWECDPNHHVCLQPKVDEIGLACESHHDCNSATNHIRGVDRCLDEGDEHSSTIKGGFCTMNCSGNDVCPEGTRCADDGTFFDDTGTILLSIGYCVNICDDDSDCPRDNYGCYDANLDGQKECWHKGTGSSDFGDSCEWSEECGEIGEYAVCRTQYDDDFEPTGDAICSQHCGDEEVECPEGWYCGDTEFGFVKSCIQDVVNETIGEACDDDDQCGEVSDPTTLSPDCLSADTGGQSLHEGYCRIANCSEDEQCPADSHCTGAGYSLVDDTGMPIITGSCVASCSSDADCPRDGYGCYDASGDGRTECWHVGVGSTSLGEECDTGYECDLGEGAICSGGAQKGRCTTTCSADESCPSDYGCSMMGVCSQRCDDNDECPELYICQEDWIVDDPDNPEGGCW